MSLRGMLTVVSRLMIVLIFAMSAIGSKIPNFNGVAECIRGVGIPLPHLLLVGAILFLITGSVSIVLEYHSRIGAALLFIFLIPASYYFHNFWAFEGHEQQMQLFQFLKNVGLGGTMLFIIANGPGPWSLDGRIGEKGIPNAEKQVELEGLGEPA